MEQQQSDVKKRVMLVEDDVVLIKMYSTKLEAAGFTVLSASDGEKGLKLAEENSVDILILDLMMPKMSGIDVLTHLRKSPKFKQDTPILILSNLTEKNEIEKAKSLGVKEFLVKANLVPSEIVDAIKKYL